MLKSIKGGKFLDILDGKGDFHDNTRRRRFTFSVLLGKATIRGHGGKVGKGEKGKEMDEVGGDIA